MTRDRTGAEPGALLADGGTTADASAGADSGTGSAEVGSDADAAGSDADDGRLSARAARRYLAYGALVGLSLLAAFAVVGFYTSANAAINEWVVREFRPPFRAALNLAVLLFALAGIYRLLDRLRD